MGVAVPKRGSLPAGLRFYHPDHLGSTHVVTDQAGQLLEHREYTPYGSLAAAQSPEPAASSPFGFTGQRQEGAHGLILFPARAYDPQLGRFLQPDPFIQDPADPQTLNRYTYVRNNPVKYVDPSGNFFWFFIAALLIGGLIGGFTSLLQGGSFGQGFLIGAAVAATFAVASAAVTALLPGLLGPAIAGSALGQVGIEAASLAVGGALSGGLGSVLQGGSFGHGALVGGAVSLATFGVGRALGPVFQDIGSQFSETMGPKIGNALTGVAQSSVGQQISKFLNKAGLGSKGAAESTELVQRAMSRAELEATKEMGFLRGGRIGTPENPHYVSDAVNSNALRARQRLALPQTPEVRATLEIPKGVFSSPSEVSPNYRMYGGGKERIGFGKVRARVLRVDEMK